MDATMTAAAGLATAVAVLLRAGADACDAFARTLTAHTVHAPDVVPAWLNEEVDLP